MKKLLYTTTAFVLCGGIVQANAACIATPSCYDMGYSSTSSCDSGLKCPFGDYWYCPKDGECAEFPYTCFGRGYVEAAGIGADCNGKYVKCECYEGFEWKDGKGCVESSTECKIGSILYSDMSCSSSGYDNDYGIKTAIGVVVYIGDDGKRWALALESIGSYDWGRYNTIGQTEDISGLTNYTSETSASKDYASCENSEKIRAHGNNEIHAAAWAAYNYSTEGTKAGDWCLPAAGIFTSIYNNHSTINTGFNRAGGILYTENSDAWSSSERSYEYAWMSTFNNRYGVQVHSKNFAHNVYPVLEF